MSQFSQIIGNLIKTPRGLVAVTVAVGSFAALVYLFLFKGNSSSCSPKHPSKRTASKATPVKSVNKRAITSSIKKSPATPKKEGTQQQEQKVQSSRKKSETKTKDPPVKAATKLQEKSATPPSSKKSVVGQVKSKTNISSQKDVKNDDDEWKTVSKKKAKVNKRAATVASPPSVPRTRSSTKTKSL